MPIEAIDPFGLDVIITITRNGYSSTGNSLSGTINVSSNLSPIAPFNGYTLENSRAGNGGSKPPIPGGSYSAHLRRDHNPNRIELNKVPGYQNIQIHQGNFPRNFIGCFGVGTSQSLDFIGGSTTAMKKILDIIRADGSGNINVNVGSIPSLPSPPSNPFQLGL
jgi:hypothetical protein